MTPCAKCGLEIDVGNHAPSSWQAWHDFVPPPPIINTVNFRGMQIPPPPVVGSSKGMAPGEGGIKEATLKGLEYFVEQGRSDEMKDWIPDLISEVRRLQALVRVLETERGQAKRIMANFFCGACSGTGWFDEADREGCPACDGGGDGQIGHGRNKDYDPALALAFLSRAPEVHP